jgi:PKD repeat protein
MLSVAACTTSQTTVPPLSGPSELALSLRVSANPDSLSQDGASRSTIVVNAFDANGKARPGLRLRMDMLVGGTLQDFGTLADRTITTDTNGQATTVYTAPPPPPPALGGAGAVVTIVATPIGTDFQASNPQIATIRLVPPGVILPPADIPTAKFTITPTPVNLNVATIFDGSTSCGGQINNGQCTSLSQVVSYNWDFGDGRTGTGKTTTHAFTTVGTFSVTLTVTNDRGVVSAPTVQQVTTAASAAPTGDFVVSPTAPAVGDRVQFNAYGVQAAPGHTIVQYSWDFGDPTSANNTASGPVATHQFGTAGSYVVVLSVRDDADQKLTITHTVSVGSGQPKAQFTFAVTSPATHTIQVDGSGSTAAGGATIVSYAWAWGDGTSNPASAAAIASHSYASAGAQSVTLTVTDSLGRVGTFSQSVTVP